MRPDKKKKNRGKYADKSVDSSDSGKNIETKSVPASLDGTKAMPGESAGRCPTETTEKTKSGASALPVNEASSDSLPAPTLRRETDALKEVKKSSKRQIFSDWKEYDKPVLQEDLEEDRLRDFTALIQQNVGGKFDPSQAVRKTSGQKASQSPAPGAVRSRGRKAEEDNYFKFKHERQWENDSCNINRDLFNLNLQQLSAGLQCIPFFERLNLSTSLFSKSEVKRMQSYAKEQEKLYEKILKGEDVDRVDYLCKEVFNVQITDKSCRAPGNEIQEQSNTRVGEVLTTHSFISTTNNSSSVNEFSKCVSHKEQDSVNEKTQIKAKEGKHDEKRLNLNETNQVHIKDESEINLQEENELSISQGQKHVAEKEMDSGAHHKETEVAISEGVDFDSATAADVPKDTHVLESTSAEISDVAVNSPLGQRVRTPRSREARAKGSDKISTHGDEEKVLDSLLSLKEPSVTSADSGKREIGDAESEADNLTSDLKSIVIHEKKENLEEWLDSMLDD